MNNKINLALPVFLVIAGGLLFAGFSILTLDLKSNDGVLGILALFGMPLLVSSFIVLIWVENAQMLAAKELGKKFWWLVGGLFPAGSLSIFLVAAFQDPEYYALDESGGVWSGIGLWFLAFTAAVLCGALFYMGALWPLVVNFKLLVAKIKGEKVRGISFILPNSVLVFTVTAFVIAGALDTDLIGKAGGVALWLAVIGIPGPYEIKSQEMLWLARALTALWLGGIWYFIASSKRKTSNEA